jgi:UDP-N-acetylmuramoylalanine--D-glutamate ligase
MGRAVVVGLARSGIGAAKLLKAEGYEVTVTDLKTEEELGAQVAELGPGVKLALGGHPESVFRDVALVVVSPGVPLGIAPLEGARQAGTEIIGELELAYRHMQGLPFYAVTGTNGKSTTATLLGGMMKAAGRESLLAGNIGNPLSGEIAVTESGGVSIPRVDCVVVELSSFQLEAIRSFRPRGAVILNITPDHLDRYASMDEYRLAKERVALNQTGEDVLVLNADDPECMRVGRAVQEEKGRRSPRTFFFSRHRDVRGVFLKAGKIAWDFRGAGAGELLEARDVRIKGVHNLENALAASALALLSGCAPDAVAEVLKEFPGLEHRLEVVRELRGVTYVNDSKGTNVSAAVMSVRSFETPVVLIAGGRDKRGDFAPLAEALRERAKAVVLIGEASGKMRAAFKDTVDIYLVGGLRDAVRQASDLASEGDVVLLSPACASFDMFEDFEDRGRRFKELVREL